MGFATKQLARCEAKRLKAALPEPNRWRIEVWENSGWCFRYLRGPFSLRCDTSGRWSCMISRNGNDGTGGPWTTPQSWYRTPDRALKVETEAALAWMSRFDELRMTLLDSGYGNARSIQSNPPIGSLHCTTSMLEDVVVQLGWGLRESLAGRERAGRSHVRNQMRRLNNYQQLLRLLVKALERGEPLPRKLS